VYPDVVVKVVLTNQGAGMLSALVQKTPMPSSWQSSLAAIINNTVS
jgi:hypothetical protein